MDEDLNLLAALDALLGTGSVAKAAARLGLSASAMSRTLARLRLMTGDPLLVRAGRGLVPTPRALMLRNDVPRLLADVRTALRPVADVDLSTLQRRFSIRANEGFTQAFAPTVIGLAQRGAPGVQLRFVPKPDKAVMPLRDGSIDLEIGVLGESGPEIRIQALFTDRFVGVARSDHALRSGEITPERYAAEEHVVVSRHGRAVGPVDDALAALGLKRHVAAVVPGFPAAIAIAVASDLVALVPARQTAPFRAGTWEFALPVRTAPLTVSQMWHPRLDADPAHRWLRGLVLEVCRACPG